MKSLNSKCTSQNDLRVVQSSWRPQREKISRHAPQALPWQPCRTIQSHSGAHEIKISTRTGYSAVRNFAMQAYQSSGDAEGAAVMSAVAGERDVTSAAAAAADVFEPLKDIKPFLSDAISLELTPGSGLGWVTSRHVKTGEVLMISSPLAIVHSEQGNTRPTGVELFDHIIKQQELLSSRQRRWLDVLQGPGRTTSEAEEGASAGEAAKQESGAQGQSVEEQSEGASSTSGSGSGEADGSQARRLQTALRLIAAEQASSSNEASIDEEPVPEMHQGRSLALRVGGNSYGHPSQDPGMQAVRRVPPERYPGGHAGVFPWYSFLNHSCCPNTSYMVVGEMLVVRAAVDVEAGEQLAATYIGPRVLEPLAQRRAYLERAYGFTCWCPRCAFESSLPESVTSFVDIAAGACDMGQKLSAMALEKNDVKALQDTEEMLFKYKESFYRLAGGLEMCGTTKDGGCLYRMSPDIETESSGVARDVRGTGDGHEPDGLSLEHLHWLEASLWRLPAMQLDLFGGDLDPDSLSEAVQIAQSVAPGSDLHIFLTACQMMAADRLIRASEARAAGLRQWSRMPDGEMQAFQEAVEACREAYVARYGPTSQQVFETLLTANMALKWEAGEVESCLQRME